MRPAKTASLEDAVHTFRIGLRDPPTRDVRGKSRADAAADTFNATADHTAWLRH